MHLIIIQDVKNCSGRSQSDLLRLAVSSATIAGITFNRLSENCPLCKNGQTTIALAERWQVKSFSADFGIIHYNQNTVSLPLNSRRETSAGPWCLISNGSFLAYPDHELLNRVLAEFDDDLIAVNAEPALSAGYEKVCIGSKGSIAGFRRLYGDCAEASPFPSEWPHHVFVKPGKLKEIFANEGLPLNFSKFLTRCRDSSLKCNCVKIGGPVVDLRTESGLLNLLAISLRSGHHRIQFVKAATAENLYESLLDQHSDIISTSARFFGEVVLGDNVTIGDNAVIVGPAIISDNVKIGEDAAIRTSIIGEALSIPKACFLQNRVLVKPDGQTDQILQYRDLERVNNSKAVLDRVVTAKTNYRTWPFLSYPRCIKRSADIIISLIILILFLPIFPVIAIAIKLNSSGPVFFKHKRQGLGGKEFNCLKFRTMIIGAERIQDDLRFKNQVDGPQFKMENDPRITIVGQFLRKTFIDEIPQFINILLGQMSVAGPRPSPKHENAYCPVWRDARLSVRPGITGLWQISRTRQSGQDFQEWIYFDIKYVKDLSLGLDLFICWQTAKKLITNFIDQF